jgi:hypothetical protein
LGSLKGYYTLGVKKRISDIAAADSWIIQEKDMPGHYLVNDCI